MSCAVCRVNRTRRSCVSGINIGGGSTGNKLVITNGGVVYGGGTVGVAGSSSNNLVLVADSGSVWNGQPYIGYSGPGNRLVVTNGGAVQSIVAYVGYNDISSSNNSVLVTGSGSVWSVQQSLTVGDMGGYNHLVISNGGAVYDGNGNVGLSSGNNTALVTGSGSMWNQATSILVGYLGGTNQLTIDSGATVMASNACVTYNFTAPGNRIDVTGGSFYVTNATHDAILDVRCGQVTLSSGLLQADIVVVTNACGRLIHNGGTLIVGSLILDPNLSAVGDGIPNGWKLQHNLDPFDPTLGSEDPDGDGMNNLQEYLSGTDPINSGSSFRVISVVPTGKNMLVTWMTASGRTNALQAAAGDATGGYGTNGFNDIFVVTNTAGTVTNYLDIGAATNLPSRYYRVRLVP